MVTSIADWTWPMPPPLPVMSQVPHVAIVDLNANSDVTAIGSEMVLRIPN